MSDLTWSGSRKVSSGHPSRHAAWLAYQTWVEELMQSHGDVGLECAVTIRQGEFRRWTFTAKAAPCPEG